MKQPSGEQMSKGITWSEARAAEIEFFGEGDPWSSLDTLVRSRLGTVPLTKALGEALLALIVKRLVNTAFVIEVWLTYAKDYPNSSEKLMLISSPARSSSPSSLLASTVIQLGRSGDFWPISSKM